MVVSGPKQVVHRFAPGPNRLAVHLYDDVANDRRADSFVRQGETNVRRVAAIELQDGPDRRSHLLSLHVGGVPGNAQGAEADKRGDDRIISGRRSPRLLFRHSRDVIASTSSVNQSSFPPPSLSVGRRALSVFFRFGYLHLFRNSDFEFRIFSFILCHWALSVGRFPFVSSVRLIAPFTSASSCRRTSPGRFR